MAKFLAQYFAPSPVIRVRLLVIVATLYWAYYAIWEVVFSALSGPDYHGHEVWIAAISRLLMHAMLLPILIVFYMVGFRLAGRAGNSFATAFIHVVLGFCFGVIASLLHYVAVYLLSGNVYLGKMYSTDIIAATFIPIQIWLVAVFARLVAYLVGILIIIGINAHLDLQAERIQSSELSEKWLRAKLDMLRGQLNPHFLFNSLHTISALVHADPHRADKLLADLSDVLRITLYDGKRDFSSVSQELEYVRRYLEIEETRFEDRLTVSIEVEASANEARIPSLILQPLVENAVKYGVSSSAGANRIIVAISRDDGQLVLSVINDYRPKRIQEPERKTGIGLNNVRERLMATYGTYYSVSSGPIPGDRWATCITIPFEVRPD